MFSIDIAKGEYTCLNAIVNNESWLWHLHFGHFLNFRSLKMLAKGNMVKILLDIQHQEQLCEACVIGKSHRLPFLGEQWRATQPFQLIHLDVCGLMNIVTNGGNSYFFYIHR